MGVFLITIQTCFSTYLVLFLTRELDFPILLAGTYFMIAFFCGAVGRVCWSAFSDYSFHGRRKPVLFINCVFLVVICCLLGFVPLSSSQKWIILLLIATFGLTGIGWNAIWITMVGEIVERESSGLAVAEAFFIGIIGSLVGPPVFGYIVDATGSFVFAWQFLAISAFAVIVLLGLFQEKTRIR
jgi:MFS family permease